MLKKLFSFEEVELTYGQCALLGLGAIAVGTFLYFWLTGELHQWGTTYGVVGRI